MNFQQLRSVRETVRQGFNLTAVADTLHTSQPGVSRQIKELEDELGVSLFRRSGRRFLGLTPPGEVALPIIERLLLEAANLKARYALPTAVRDFRDQHTQVALHLQQGSPRQIAEWVLKGQADLGVATEALADYPDLVTLPCYRWTHVVVVPPEHPLAQAQARGEALTLQALARHPLVTYEPGYTGRSHIDEAFQRAGLRFEVVLSAMDADVIKTYVDLGIGVGVVASVAIDDARDRHLVAIDAGHLFALNTTRVAVKRGAYLRSYVLDFIQTFAPTLTPEVVLAAMDSPPGTVIDL